MSIFSQKEKKPPKPLSKKKKNLTFPNSPQKFSSFKKMKSKLDFAKSKFSLQEEISLLKAHVWQTKNEEKKLRRKLNPAEKALKKSSEHLQNAKTNLSQQIEVNKEHLKKLETRKNSLKNNLNHLCNVKFFFLFFFYFFF